MREYLFRRIKPVLELRKHALDGKSVNAKKWASIIDANKFKWETVKQRSEKGPRVLMATSMGGFDHGIMLESALAAALTLRGATVESLLCDRFLPVCQLTKISSVSPDKLLAQSEQSRCRSCHRYGRDINEALGIPIRWYGHFVEPGEAAEVKEISSAIPFDRISGFRFQNLKVGEHAHAGALRYFARGDLQGEEFAVQLARKYLEASLLSVYAIRNLLKENDYDVVCFHHGIYVPQGLIGEVCRNHNIRVVNWNPSYRKQTFIFSHEDSYHHTMISEPNSDWEHIRWDADVERVTSEYLMSRWQGTQDWIWFHENPVENLEAISKELGIDLSKICIGLLTNVVWDAQLHYKSNAFPDMIEWVLKTISYFAKRPDLQLIIRAHPAEIRGFIPSRQPILAEIQKAFPTLPANVVVIPPESRISTYAVMATCNAVIIYNTKTGIEISSMGIPVIVAGEAWIRNKGFSFDANNPEEYFKILDRLPFDNGLDENQLERAKKYAFHFFFRRMIPIPFIRSPERAKFALELTDLSDLEEGKSRGLDIICDGILYGKPFIYRAENLLTSLSHINDESISAP